MITIPGRAIVFDLDGVLANSIAMVEKAWRAWALSHSLDPDQVIEITHGRRKTEIIATAAPWLDAQAEAHRIIDMEMDLIHEVIPIPGAQAFVESLPAGCWAIATSGEKEMAKARLRQAGMPIPQSFVAAEDVVRGKPNPECYLKAVAGIGFSPSDCLVFEDAPLGVEGAIAGGMTAIGVSTTYPVEALHRAVVTVPDFRTVRALISGGKLQGVLIGTVD